MAGSGLTAPNGQKIRLLREPTDQQWLFINSLARELLFGGAKRGGKSVAIGFKAYFFSFFFPGNRGLMFRHDFTDLHDTTLFEFFQTVPRELLDPAFGNGTGHNKGDREIRVRSYKEGVSSSILYRGMGGMTERDMEKVKSMNLGWIAGDELSEVPKAQYDMLNAQLTWILPDGTRPPYQSFNGSNPEPGWVMDKWVGDPENPYAHVQVEKGLEFIPSLPRQNPHLPPGYEDFLRKTYDPEWVNKYLEGSWAVIEGQFFQIDGIFHDLRTEWITRDWVKTLKLILTIDYAETGVIAATVNGFDRYDNQFVLHEYYKEGQLISGACREISEMCEIYCPEIDEGQEDASPFQSGWRKRFAYCLIDPETCARTLEEGNRKQSVMQAFQNGGAGSAGNPKYGIPCSPAWNALQLGLQHLRERIAPQILHRHPFSGLSPAPHLYICRRQCPNTWKNFKECRKKVYPTGKVKFLGEDHGLDTVRYASNSQLHDPNDPNFLTGETNEDGLTGLERMMLQKHRTWAAEWDRECVREQDTDATGSWY